MAKAISPSEPRVKEPRHLQLKHFSGCKAVPVASSSNAYWHPSLSLSIAQRLQFSGKEPRIQLRRQTRSTSRIRANPGLPGSAIYKTIVHGLSLSGGIVFAINDGITIHTLQDERLFAKLRKAGVDECCYGRGPIQSHYYKYYFKVQPLTAHCVFWENFLKVSCTGPCLLVEFQDGLCMSCSFSKSCRRKKSSPHFLDLLVDCHLQKCRQQEDGAARSRASRSER